MRLKIPFLILCSLLLTGGNCLAQFYPTQYRPAGQQWHYLSTPHFKVVYAAGDDNSALQIGRILEHQYDAVGDLAGGSLSDFPVILNSYNDRSNGFVTTLHFRSEIELPPSKGKSMNPQTGSWYENVGPHELVHAMQFSNLGGYNLPRLVSLISPDLARSFHGGLPPGIPEGIAVYHETKHIAPNGGRGNHPYFYNQFNAVFQSEDRWSMRQMIQDPDFTRPFSRHYLGGYEFISWLQDTYGEELQQDLLDFYMDWPFLGYGFALRIKTGNWPGKLYSNFTEEKEKSLARSNIDPNQLLELDVPFSGRDIRRPKWLSDSTLVFYGSFYNARPGFYRFDLSTGRTVRLLTTSSIQDYSYDLSSDRKNLVYSFYDASKIYDRTYKAEIAIFDLDTGNNTQITQNGRVYGPKFYENGLLALQSRPGSSALVSISDEETGTSIDQLLSLGDDEITAAVPDPSGSGKIAVVANKRGIQALWISGRKDLQETLAAPPDISFRSGSIYDPQWHPRENRLLFSSDFSGTLQIYEYEPEAQSLKQLTDYNFNAFEGSYRPDGNRLAFIIQKNNERIPALLDRSDFEEKVIPKTVWESDERKNSYMRRTVVADTILSDSQSWEIGRYRSNLSWLKPRAFLPVFEEISNRGVYRTGLSLHSNDLLQSQSYRAEFSYAQERIWYDLSYQNKTFWPGFKARIFSRPAYRTFTQEGQSDLTLLREERSFALSTPINIRLNQNIFSTSLFLEPEIRQSQVRYFGIDNSTIPVSDFGNLTISNLKSRFNYRLQQNIRDLQPNSGLILFSELEHYLNSESLIINNEIEQVFATPTALRGGLFTYLSPLRHWNQSLRVGVRALTQTHPVFDNQTLVSRGFSGQLFENSTNLVSLDTRYTIPLAYVDDGWLLLPFYLTNIYMVAFTNTVTDPTQQPLLNNSRTVLGLQLRTQFRFSNFSLDIGIGVGYEPTRNNYEVFFDYF